ncbi:MAG: DUF2087 domain-containing protein [Sulfitobacter sp.]
MSKEKTPLAVADITPFARALSKQLHAKQKVPSHLALLNMLARSAGFRNYQHLRASQAAKRRLDAGVTAVDFKRVEKTLQQFDQLGCLIRWPSKRYVQELCLWGLWSRFPRNEVLQEPDVNAILNLSHRFDDPAILRRNLIAMKLMQRNPDGSDYLRIEQAPPPEAIVIIREITARASTP